MTGRRPRRERHKVSSDSAKVLRPTLELPMWSIASEEQAQKIHDVSLRLLEEAGIAFYDDESVEILRSHGVSVDDEQIARFDRETIEHFLAMPPPTFEHTARNPEKSVILGDNHIVFAPAAGPPFAHDMERGRREGTLEDLENFIKMSNATPYLHQQGTEIVVPGDVPFHERALDINYAHITLGDKPYMGHYGLGATAFDSVEMAKIVFGEDVVAAKHVLLGIINVSSPRRLDDRMLGTIKVYGRANQPLCITPFILAGAMGPAAVLGTVAQANAESLATIAFTQMINPGLPVIYGPFLATLDLQSGSPVFGAAESLLAQALCGQMAARYNLPFRAAGTYVSSKMPDMQAGMEGIMSMLPSLLARPNFVLHAAGWLENGLTTGYEKFALDVDMLGMFHKLVAGVSWDEEEWAMDSLLNEVQPGGHHLGTAHTMGRFREAFHRTELMDHDSYETWNANGAHDSAARATAGWKTLLDRWERPPLDDAIDAELLDYMARRRTEIDPAEFQ